MIREMIESCEEVVEYYLSDRGLILFFIAVLAFAVSGRGTLGWYLLGIYLSMMIIATYKTYKKIQR